MKEKTLIEYLEAATKDDLIKKMKIIGFKYTGLNKPDIVKILNDYLLNENHINRIWNGLNPFEKEYLEEFLKYDEKPNYKVMNNLYKKYDIKRGYFEGLWEKQSAMNLLFTNSIVPAQLKSLLVKYLTPISIRYDIKDEIAEEWKNIINIIGGSFAVDFSNVVSLAKSISLALTKEKGVPSKSSIIKINNVLFNKEIVLKDIGSIDKVSSIENIGRIYAVFMLMLESNLLYKNNVTLNISYEADTFLGLKIQDKCRYLLRYYLSSKRIFELNRIVESEYKTERKGNMTECRNIIIKHLKNCPVGKWIPVSQFVDYIKMVDKKFLINQVGDITYYSHKYRMYLEPWVEWEQLEGVLLKLYYMNT